MPARHPLRFGLKFSQQVHPIDVHTDVWRIGDEAGFDHIWPFDHLIALGPDPAAPIFDGWTALGAMAALTKRARMGLNVTGNLYRHPGLLAKIAVTVDHLSNGRLEFGIGTGWNEPEFTQFGLPFPNAGDRVGMLDESLKAMKLLWKEPRRDRRAKARPAPPSADLDRVQRRANAAPHRTARERLAFECANFRRGGRAEQEPRRGVPRTRT